MYHAVVTLQFVGALAFTYLGMLPGGRQMELMMKNTVSGSSMTPSQVGQPAIDPRAALDRVNRAIQAEAVGPAVYRLTPPFPLAWPPSSDKRLAYFAYTIRSLPTGTVQYVVWSPSLQVDLDLADATASPRIARLQPRELASHEHPVAIAPAVDPMPAAQRLLFAAVASGQDTLSNTDAALIRQAYRTWARQHQAIAKEIRGLASGFFKWLDVKP